MSEKKPAVPKARIQGHGREEAVAAGLRAIKESAREYVDWREAKIKEAKRGKEKGKQGA